MGMLQDMREDGVQPDLISYSTVLAAVCLNTYCSYNLYRSATCPLFCLSVLVAWVRVKYEVVFIDVQLDSVCGGKLRLYC